MDTEAPCPSLVRRHDRPCGQGPCGPFGGARLLQQRGHSHRYLRHALTGDREKLYDLPKANAGTDRDRRHRKCGFRLSSRRRGHARKQQQDHPDPQRNAADRMRRCPLPRRSDSGGSGQLSRFPGHHEQWPAQPTASSPLPRLSNGATPIFANAVFVRKRNRAPTHPCGW